LTAPVPVKTLPACVGGVPGLYDMSGNVFEWQDGCEPRRDAGGPLEDDCPATGGDYGEVPSTMRCAAREIHSRHDQVGWVGFRCCKDL
jgi:formylglycine-generating enzyme required for sulfatase activity